MGGALVCCIAAGPDKGFCLYRLLWLVLACLLHACPVCDTTHVSLVARTIQIPKQAFRSCCQLSMCWHGTCAG